MPSSAYPVTVREYLRANGSCPYRDWLNTLDVPMRARIQARIARFQSGHFGDTKPVGNGILEARLMFGPGYRVYFARDGKHLVILLGGGSKRSQPNDIRVAQQRWDDYQASAS